MGRAAEIAPINSNYFWIFSFPARDFLRSQAFVSGNIMFQHDIQIQAHLDFCADISSALTAGILSDSGVPGIHRV